MKSIAEYVIAGLAFSLIVACANVQLFSFRWLGIVVGVFIFGFITAWKQAR